MRSHDSRRPRADSRCRLRPDLEGLEPRELPSTVIPGTGGESVVNAFGSDFLQRVSAALYSPDVPPGTPTPAELKRESFASRWVGQYTIGSPRFSDRSSTIFLYGKTGGSNQFLKGKFEISLFPPADPNAAPTPGNPLANQVTGIASLYGQSYLQSGSMLVLDLNGTASPNALPSQMTWAYDANTSAGPYAAPGNVVAGGGFTRGAGAVVFQWQPDAHPQPGTEGSGRVIVTFEGLIQASGIMNPIAHVIS